MSHIIDINTSNEGTPVLTVSRETMYGLGSSTCIVNVITGEKAMNLWEELTRKKYCIEISEEE